MFNPGGTPHINLHNNMCKNFSPKMWKRIADSLRERNNHYAPTGVNVELSFNDEGDGSIEITPSETNINGQLCCLEHVVDVCRAFGLTFYVSLTPLPHVMPCVRIY